MEEEHLECSMMEAPAELEESEAYTQNLRVTDWDPDAYGHEERHILVYMDTVNDILEKEEKGEEEKKGKGESRNTRIKVAKNLLIRWRIAYATKVLVSDKVFLFLPRLEWRSLQGWVWDRNSATTNFPQPATMMGDPLSNRYGVLPPRHVVQAFVDDLNPVLEDNMDNLTNNSDSHNTASGYSLMNHFSDMSSAVGSFLSEMTETSTENNTGPLDRINDVAADVATTIRGLWPTQPATDSQQTSQAKPLNDVTNLINKLWSSQSSLNSSSPAYNVTNTQIMAKLTEITKRLDVLEANSKTPPASESEAVTKKDVANIMERMDKSLTVLHERVTAVKWKYVDGAQRMRRYMTEKFNEMSERLDEDKIAMEKRFNAHIAAIHECFDMHDATLNERLDKDKPKMKVKEVHIDQEQSRMGEHIAWGKAVIRDVMDRIRTGAAEHRAEQLNKAVDEGIAEMKEPVRVPGPFSTTTPLPATTPSSSSPSSPFTGNTSSSPYLPTPAQRDALGREIQEEQAPNPPPAPRTVSGKYRPAWSNDFSLRDSTENHSRIEPIPTPLPQETTPPPPLPAEENLEPEEIEHNKTFGFQVNSRVTLSEEHLEVLKRRDPVWYALLCSVRTAEAEVEERSGLWERAVEAVEVEKIEEEEEGDEEEEEGDEEEEEGDEEEEEGDEEEEEQEEEQEEEEVAGEEVADEGVMLEKDSSDDDW
ncbi:hypothetical protein QBC36DRAFT_299447 [Triangularia setosa]|uniref:Uncharacterized protein n=1 Tax=Triangularia setosa TaxID=2587417 RepID=A0AAN7A7N4_9PEZI|nr:hypothetical protein QBC36DRAFT_299447 [Podospora setosa]